MSPSVQANTLAAGFVLLGTLQSEPLRAYEWLTDLPIGNRTQDILWEFNPRDCPAGTREVLHQASNLLDFYTLTRFSIRYKQDAEIDHAVDGRHAVLCSPVLEYMQRGFRFQSAGVTLIARSQGLITDADIILNADRISFDVALHEFTHMLGLNHSAAPHSIVCYSETPGHCHSRGRLDADDLVGLASLYDVPANCTPYLSDDLWFYFPYIDGFWAELRPLYPGDPDKGYIAAASGLSLEYDWQCSLLYSTGFEKVVAEIYHRGEAMEAEFLRHEGVWQVSFTHKRKE